MNERLPQLLDASICATDCQQPSSHRIDLRRMLVHLFCTTSSQWASGLGKSSSV